MKILTTTFFDPTFFLLAVQENAPMCATWLRVAENDKLLFGDELGILHTYTFNDEWGG